MTWIFILLEIVLVTISVLFYFMRRGFINPVEKHIVNTNASFLLIHGAEDVTVPVEEGKRLAKAAGNHAELWIIPHRGHSDCHLEKRFWEKVIGFMKR